MVVRFQASVVLARNLFLASLKSTIGVPTKKVETINITPQEADNFGGVLDDTLASLERYAVKSAKEEVELIENKTIDMTFLSLGLELLIKKTKSRAAEVIFTDILEPTAAFKYGYISTTDLVARLVRHASVNEFIVNLVYKFKLSGPPVAATPPPSSQPSLPFNPYGSHLTNPAATALYATPPPQAPKSTRKSVTNTMMTALEERNKTLPPNHKTLIYSKLSNIWRCHLKERCKN